jgi:hypothetical protein
MINDSHPSGMPHVDGTPGLGQQVPQARPNERVQLAQEITTYLDEGWDCPPDAQRMLRDAVRLLVASPAARTKAV